MTEPPSRDTTDPLLTSLVEQLPQRVFLVSADGEVRYANLAARSKVGEVLGDPSLPSLLGTQGAALVLEALGSVRRSSRSRSVELRDPARPWAPAQRLVLHPVLAASPVQDVWVLGPGETPAIDGWSWRGDFPTLAALLGRLAQDFNEQLVGVLGGAELARSSSTDHLARRWLDQVSTAAAGAVGLTSQLQAIAGTTARREPVRLEDITAAAVSEAAQGLALGLGVHVGLVAESHDVVVFGDAVLLAAALRAVLDNAVEAVALDGGTVRVRVYRSFVASSPHNVFPERLRPGRYGIVEVVDDGPGVDPAVRQRIFEPFVSTKAAGRGLGLTVVAGALRSSGGGVQLDNTAAPTRFRILLPEIAGEQVDPGNRPEVLVVCVERAGVARHRELLESLGYEVSILDNALQLAPRLVERAGKIDVVLLDLDGGPLGVRELVEDLRAHAIEVPVVVLSSGAYGPADAGVVVLRKPVNPASLAVALETARSGGLV